MARGLPVGFGAGQPGGPHVDVERSVGVVHHDDFQKTILVKIVDHRRGSNGLGCANARFPRNLSIVTRDDVDVTLTVAIDELAGDHHGEQRSRTASLNGRFTGRNALREIPDDRAVSIAFGLVAEHLPVYNGRVEGGKFDHISHVPIARSTVWTVVGNRLIVSGSTSVLSPRLLRLVPRIVRGANHRCVGQRLPLHEGCENDAQHEPYHAKRHSTVDGAAG